MISKETKIFFEQEMAAYDGLPLWMRDELKESGQTASDLFKLPISLTTSSFRVYYMEGQWFWSQGEKPFGPFDTLQETYNHAAEHVKWSSQ